VWRGNPIWSHIGGFFSGGKGLNGRRPVSIDGAISQREVTPDGLPFNVVLERDIGLKVVSPYCCCLALPALFSLCFALVG
jgi:hypothetical protein